MGGKGEANTSGWTSDCLTYCKLRNYVTKLNKKKKLIMKPRSMIQRMMEKKHWSTLNEIMGRKTNSTPSFIQSDGLFITKPFDVANSLND